MKVLSADPVNWTRPTGELLIRATDLKNSSVFKRRIAASTVACAAIASAALESLGELAVGSALLTCACIKTPICYALRGTFVVTWIAISYICDQALVKSPVRWLQFGALQAMIGIRNPKHWWAQWKLWANILHGMAAFANGAAVYADKVDKAVDCVSSWKHSSNHLMRSVKLALFAVSSLPSAPLNPKKMITKYESLVEPTRFRGSLLKRMGRCAWNHRHALTAVMLAAASVSAHIMSPGARQREEWALQCAETAKTQILFAADKAWERSQTLSDLTLGRLVRYFTNVPDWHTINSAFREMTTIIRTLEEENKGLRERSAHFS